MVFLQLCYVCRKKYLVVLIEQTIETGIDCNICDGKYELKYETLVPDASFNTNFYWNRETNFFMAYQ